MHLSPDKTGSLFPLESMVTTTACPPDLDDVVYQKQLFALVPTIIIMVLSIATYGLRLFCRKKTGQKIWWDDYLMGVGLLLSLDPAICELLLLQNGLGHHICNVPPVLAARFAKITFALQRANQPALACVKISIVLFYMRIFTTRKFRIAAYCVMAYTIVWAISTWIVNLTTCSPIAFYYDKTIPGGKCRNQAISGSINGGLSLLGDIMVLALPIPVVWSLKINLRKKVGIMGIFLLGIFVCVAAVIRIIELTKFVFTDPTYTQVHASTWTDLEQGVAVISGNLPLLAPLFEHYLRGRGSSASGSGSGYSYGSKVRRLESSGTHGDPGGSRTSKFNGGNPRTTFHGAVGTTTISAQRSGTHNDIYRLSDEESQTQADSAPDIELGDRAILVKTQVTVTESKGPDIGTHQTKPASKLGGRKTSANWLRD
ncbi:hypothetical protein CONLIGDRAFT_684574 [Coniochaeta ligniaria NRRL 30616]|uniref:Rhodopsin domain-containing protein n=1 Tax=Coniochaeta ligniaria NRRL 30616 TaxID=1408157 RepID=A0A1J7JA07_9PEZI|nr:hypothetical protein CONLIGDRAFT_684574 [Coniochaeta ligniaria NRRL 30616]